MPSDVVLNVDIFPFNDLDDGELQRVYSEIGGAKGAGEPFGEGFADRGRFFRWWLSPNGAIGQAAG